MEETMKKPSYEELEKALVAMQNKCRILENNLMNVNVTAMRLDYLFKVVNSNATVFDADFIKECADEIKSIIHVEHTETTEKPDDTKE